MLAAAFGSGPKQLFAASFPSSLMVLPFQRIGKERAVLVVNKAVETVHVKLSGLGVTDNVDVSATVIGGDLGDEPGWSPPQARAVSPAGDLELGAYGVAIVSLSPKPRLSGLRSSAIL